MSTLLQLTIEGKEEFAPPKINYMKFIRRIADENPELLDVVMHKGLMLKFARYAGIEPDKWGVSLPEIKWLFSCSSNVERARRSFCADAF